MINAFLLHMASPSCYKTLRTNHFLTLPHESRLCQLTRSFGVSVDDAQKNKHFLKLKCNTSEEREKYVVLQIDEIYVKEKIDYKNGKIYGYAENIPEVEAAKTVAAFLISSAFGKFKEIAALRPVKDLKGETLKVLVEEVCSLLRECGFKVVVIIKRLFKLLCGPGKGYTAVKISETVTVFVLLIACIC